MGLHRDKHHFPIPTIPALSCACRKTQAPKQRAQLSPNQNQWHLQNVENVTG
jgi:hypothetical protein